MLARPLTPRGVAIGCCATDPRRQAQKAVSLGAYPAVSLSKARQRAGEIIAAAKGGVDLIAVEEREAEARRAAEAKARPLSEIADVYLDSVKRLRSWRSIESRTRCHIIPKLGNKPVGEVTRADVVEFLDDLEREEGLCHQVNRCRGKKRCYSITSSKDRDARMRGKADMAEAPPSTHMRTARSRRGIFLLGRLLARRGAYASHHQTAGADNCARRRGDVAARGARRAAGDANGGVSFRCVAAV